MSFPRSSRSWIFVSPLVFVATHACGSSNNGATPTEGSSSSSSATGGENGATTNPGPFDPECLECIANTCESPYTEALLCLLGCEPTDVVCLSACGGPTDPNEALAFQQALTCASTQCIDACTPDVPTVETGSDEASTSGTTSPLPTSSSGADSAPLETGTEDIDAGNTTSELPTDGILWLTLEGDAAPAELGDNALAGIEGAFYVYSDDCVEVDWSPETRCASGYICNAGDEFENWGAAIGFDLRVTAKDDPIPNAKLSWSATENNALGFVWNVSGTSPTGEVQVWFLVMDPQWEGVCTSDVCEVPGPPNGVEAPFGLRDVPFNAVYADYWGPDYEPTEFDPDNLVSVQFKLPAIMGSGYFEVCIDDIGILIEE